MVEVYAMVVFRERGVNLSPEGQGYLKELRLEARRAEAAGEKGEAKLYRRDIRVMESEVEEITYHFCRVRLVQSPQRGARVPVPKWEVVRDFHEGEMTRTTLVPLKRFLPFDERMFKEHRFRAAQDNQLTRDQFDKIDFNDPYHDTYMSGGHVYLPEYLKEWESMFKRRRIDEDKLDPLPYIPYRHPIDDRKVQLRQIRFLYPETRTMPMFAALDYVRDRI